MSDIKIEDLQDRHQVYAEVIGVDNMIKLSQMFGGSSIYIPQPDELIKNRKYRSIVRGYEDGETSIKCLAQKYQVSESTVYRLVRDLIVEMKAKKAKEQYSIEGQISMFERYPGCDPQEK